MKRDDIKSDLGNKVNSEAKMILKAVRDVAS